MTRPLRVQLTLICHTTFTGWSSAFSFIPWVLAGVLPSVKQDSPFARPTSTFSLSFYGTKRKFVTSGWLSLKLFFLYTTLLALSFYFSRTQLPRNGTPDVQINQPRNNSFKDQLPVPGHFITEEIYTDFLASLETNYNRSLFNYSFELFVQKQ